MGGVNTTDISFLPILTLICSRLRMSRLTSG